MRGGLRRYVVEVSGLEGFARLLEVSSRYCVEGLCEHRFVCRGGRCRGVYLLDEVVAALIAGRRGLVLRECGVLCRGSGEAALLPPPIAPGVASRRPLLSSGERGVLIGFLGDGTPVVIGVEDLWRHVGVFGSTGSGKTHTAARIASEAVGHGLLVLVLDWHGEYGSIIDGPVVLRGEMLPRVSLVPSPSMLSFGVELFRRVLRLSQFQASILQLMLSLSVGVEPDALAAVFGAWNRGSGRQGAGLGGRISEVLADVAEIIRSENSVGALMKSVVMLWELVRDGVASGLLAGSRAETEVWAALYRRLQSLVVSRHAQLIRIRGGSPLELLEEHRGSGKVVVLDLSSIDSVGVRSLYASLLVGSLFNDAVRSRSADALIVIEESHNVFSGNDDVWSQILAESRKYRLGFVIVAHSPSLLPSMVLANLNTFIVHRTQNPADIKALRLVMGSVGSLDLARLRPGEAVVFGISFDEPLTVNVEQPAGAGWEP